MKNIRMCFPLRAGRFGGQAGQAMVEYAIISSAILLGTVTMSQFFLPLLVDAYQAYFDQFNFMINLPIP